MTTVGRSAGDGDIGTAGVTVVLPAHNEMESLPILLAQFPIAFGATPFEVIIVDDGSDDGTWETVMSLAASNPNVRGLRFTRNFGHQAALLAGMRESRGAALVVMDADGQHPVSVIPDMLAAWRDGALVVQAIRDVNAHTPALRRVASRTYYFLVRLLTGLPIVSGAADFRLLDRAVLDVVLGVAGPPPFLRALIPWMGFTTRYLPYDAAKRVAGHTSYNWRKMFALSLEGVLGYSAIPLRLAGLLGITLAGVAFVYLAYVVVLRFSGHSVVPGWASVAGLVALLSGIQLTVLAVIGEYLGRVFTHSLARPAYVIQERAVGNHE